MTPQLKRALMLVVGGTAGAQLITVIASPVLTRLYSPEDFGAFTAFVAAAAVIAVIAAARLELAIPVVAEDEVRDVVWTGASVILVVAGICAVLVAVAGDSIAQRLDVPRQVAWWLPLAVAALAAATMLNQLAVRRRQYHRYAVRKVVQAVATVGIQAACGWWLAGRSGLVMGYAIGQTIVVMSLIRGTIITPLRFPDQFRAIHGTLRTHWRYPVVLAPSGMVNTLGTQAPVFLILGLYGPLVAGFYGLAQRVLAAPVALLGTSVAQVYLGELSTLARDDHKRVWPSFVKASRALWGASLVLGLVVLAVAPIVFGPVFGSEWETSGRYAQALCIGIMGQLAASPLSQTLILAGMFRTQLLWDTVRMLASSSAVIFPAIAGWTAGQMVIMLGLAQALLYVWLWSLCRVAARRISDCEDEVTVR